MSKGRYGIHGGQYVPETLISITKTTLNLYRIFTRF